jgi:hypothetical protein
MTWQTQLNGDSLTWLLEPENPAVRYLALRDLLDYPADHPDLRAAQQAAYATGPIATFLAAMNEAGYWVRPGPGYTSIYRSTVWAIIALAQMGARADQDARLARACAYLLDHSLTEGGQFTMKGTPSSTIDCLQGNLCAALLDLGYDDPRLPGAYEWMARSVTGEGVAPVGAEATAVRYHAANCGPLFACGYNGNQSCAWGAIKVVLAFSKLPPEQHTPLTQSALQTGIAFLLSTEPALARYPSRNNTRPSPNWWKFGFPVFYITDLLQNVEALVQAGLGRDARLNQALDVIRKKQDAQGRWQLEYSYTGRTWVDFGPQKEPNKWVTLRALRVLKQVRHFRN